MHCWQDVTLKPLEDSDQYKNGWLICSRGKSFAVYAATATEKQEWMAHIKKVGNFCFCSNKNFAEFLLKSHFFTQNQAEKPTSRNI